ncbi:MAG TPA: signal peptidase II [Candidatus Dormibacteraeota bacterium]|nr:signal peptidase II [Candidatus Dormibacteraeota bacterium]
MTLPARLRWLWLTLVVVILDRATKAWFESQTPEGWSRELIHHFVYLLHRTNPGIAFSFFADSSSPWTRVILIAGSIAMILALAWLLVRGSTGGPTTSAGLSLLLAGATGNVTDRLLHGAVTDFLEVWLGSYRWPAFNLADAAITVGAVLIILDVFFGASHAAATPTSSRKRPGTRN